jgi:hypothetical protein
VLKEILQFIEGYRTLRSINDIGILGGNGVGSDYRDSEGVNRDLEW